MDDEGQESLRLLGCDVACRHRFQQPGIEALSSHLGASGAPSKARTAASSASRICSPSGRTVTTSNRYRTRSRVARFVTAAVLVAPQRAAVHRPGRRGPRSSRTTPGPRRTDGYVPGTPLRRTAGEV